MYYDLVLLVVLGMEVMLLELLLEINLVVLLKQISGQLHVVIVLMSDGQNQVMDLIILKFGIKTNQSILKLDLKIPQL